MIPVMQGFPPAPEAQVTLDNWRQRPFSVWAFQRVREIVPTAAIPAGRDSRALDAAPEPIGEIGFLDAEGVPWTVAQRLAAGVIDAMVVLRRGRIAAEWYDPLVDPDRPHLLFSVSKSLTATLAGVLMEAGALDADWLVTDLIPEAAGSAYAGATIRHVLDMTVSTAFEEAYLDEEGDYVRYRRATAWNPVPAGVNPGDLRSFLATMAPGSEPHGRRFHYVSPNSDLLGWIVERAAGRRFADLFSELIWRPLGAERDADITVDLLGAPRTAGGISALPRDLARFGEMIRCDGVVEGRRIVPAAFLHDVRTNGDRERWRNGDMVALFPEGGYRSKWYQTGRPGGLAAIGIHGQWLHVDPASETVIVVLSSQSYPVDDAADLLTIAMMTAIARAFSPP